jgi:hypothetical protein
MTDLEFNKKSGSRQKRNPLARGGQSQQFTASGVDKAGNCERKS